MGSRTIKDHIIKSTLLIVMIPLLVLGFYAISSNYESARKYIQADIYDTATAAAESVKWQMKSTQNVAIETGGHAPFTDPNSTDEAKQAALDSIAMGYGFERGNFINADGIGLDGSDYNDREYYRQAMKGNTFISDPLVSKITGKITVIIAAPVWENGIFGTKSIGCVYFVPNEEFLNDAMRSLEISENTEAYILNKDGLRIADRDSDAVKQELNYITMASSDSSYKELAEVHQKMIKGEQGVTIAKFKDHRMITAYAPIADSNGWSLAVSAPQSDFLGDTYRAMIILVVLILLAGGISVISASSLAKHIGVPIAQCTDRIKKFADGDLKSPVPKINTKDETKILADATEFLVTDINNIISDIGRMMSEMARGNFAVTPKCPEESYKGDFHVLFDAVNEINKRLNSALSQINVSADQVSSGSDQVSGGAQSLSQGATEQASSVQELAAAIHTIETKVNETTKDCDNGRNLVVETAEYIEKATRQMNALTAAMQDISGAAGEIGKIIKTIEDIAFQTNILALNAAVEAARAGEAGKGFAVVADEVRNLASKSADASQDTATYIERTIKAVERGTALTAETSVAVAEVEERSGNVKQIVENIAAASEEQADMVKQITSGIEQISSTVQTTSATAEESAAASEELSGQAQSLKNLVKTFKLRR
ncbi:MAG: methyl-accepting chemotaxis protein [Oscillospiraceae bacterium]|nr:methyl-accepting chemotaxis protein [Oscillospiraceae bacterium]